MAYKKTTWVTGDVITADKLNNIEEGIESVTGADSPNTKDIRDYIDTSMYPKGQKHVTLRPDDFSELYAEGKVLMPGSDASIAVETTNSAWKIYKYELGRAFVLRADQVVKNSDAAGCVPIAFRYKGVNYAVDYDRSGQYYLADTVLVSYNAANEAYAIEEFSFTETVRQEFSDSIICRDHAGEFDSLVVFGDSIFANTISNPDTGTLTNNGNGVTKQLANLMGVPLYKHAVDNATLSTKYTGEAQNVVKQIQDYIASPDGGTTPLFVIEGGTNDAYHYGVSNLGTYGSSDTTTIYGAIYYAINLLLSIEGVQPWQILVCTPIPKGIRALWDGTTSFSSAGWLANTDLELTTIGHAMYEIALNRQCSVINGYNAIFDELSSMYLCQMMMGDDTHPTVYGSERYARYIYDTLFSGASTKEVEEDIASLKSAIDILDALIFSAYDLSNEPTNRITISASTGKWANGSAYYTYYIAVPNHSKYVKIHANADNGTVYALLAATDTKTSGDYPVYATGSGRTFISANQEITVAIPSDCAYVWVSKQLGSPSYEPSLFGFYKDFNDVWEFETDINDLDNEIDEINDEIGIIWDGTSGVTQYTQSQLISAFGQYSTLLVYSAADRNVGKTFPSQIATTAANNAYAILMDVSDVLTFTYPKYKNSGGNGCLLMDSNYAVTRNFPCISDDTGTMATITVAPNEKYFLFGVNSYLAAMDWTFTIAKRPVEGINDLSEHVNSIGEEVGNLSDVVDNIVQNGIVPPAKLNAEIVGFICYGQSWSLGYDTNAIVSQQRYDNLMLDSGLKNNPATDPAISASEFSPLAEATTYSSDAQTTRCGETPCTAQTDVVKQLLLAENGLSDTDVKYQIFSAAPGMGNKSIEELAYGTTYYQRLIDVVTAANTIARAQNKVFVVPAISWAQGRATNGDATYYDQLEELRVHLDTDIKAITGQTIPVKLIAWQAVFGNTTPKRFYDRYVYASEKYENIICSGTYYYMNHVANNNLHLTATSQDWLGTQFGIAYKRSIVDGDKFIPLKPKAAEVYGNIVYVDFYVPVKPLTFDTTLVAEATNKGFQIIDANSTEKNITAVEIVSPDRVKLVCSSDVASTDHIVYGNVGGTDYSPTTGKRGNLRDSQSIVYTNHAGTELHCYNWCVVFDKTIAELTAGN